MSRTPLRLALARLEHEGLLDRAVVAAASSCACSRARRSPTRSSCAACSRAPRRGWRPSACGRAPTSSRSPPPRRRWTRSCATSSPASFERYVAAQRALPRPARRAGAQRRRRAGRRARDAAAVRLAGGVRAGPGATCRSPSRSCSRRSTSTTRSSTRFAPVRARAPRTSRASTRAWRCATSRSRWRAGRRASACRAPRSSATDQGGDPMAKRITPPFRADHVGSLLRPPRLLKAREDFAAGAHRRRRAARDRGRRDPRGRAHAGGRRPAVGHRRRVPPRVLAHGLHLPARRHHQGPGRQPQGPVPQRSRARSSSRPPRCTSTTGSRSTSRSSATPSSSCSECVTTATPKLTIPSPSMVHYRGGRAAIDESVYPDLDEFWADLTRAYADEVQGARRARLHLPAVRRHEPRLPQRPQPARA